MKKKNILQITPAPLHHLNGMPLHQPFPTPSLPRLDPFILLHHHGPYRFEAHNSGLPFGPHPHRGFETITLIFRGNIEHHDCRGHRSTIMPGGIQWMTAGRGIIHSENIDRAMREQGGELEIVQLWLNLPARLKMTQPGYQGFNEADIPRVVMDEGKAVIRVYAGEWNGTTGPVKSVTGTTLATLSLEAGASLDIPAAHNSTILFYLLSGQVSINEQPASAPSLVQFGEAGDLIQVSARQPAQIIYGTGIPLHEPVVTHGPYVMNTQTEILQAMRDYRMGRMGVLIED